MYLDENGNISIHAAREGGDYRLVVHSSLTPSISIHAAREGGDFEQNQKASGIDHFNPRRP